jgi:hypothetical protein
LSRAAEVFLSVSVSLILIAVRCYVEVSESELVSGSGSAVEICRQGERREQCVIGFWTGHGRETEIPCLAKIKGS